MIINFKKEKKRKSRTIAILNEEKNNDDQLIEKRKFVELAVQDLDKHLNDKETQAKIRSNLKIIIKSIDSKDTFIHDLLSFFQFPRICIELLYKCLIDDENEEEEEITDQPFSVNTALVLYCIAKLLAFNDFQNYFINNNIIISAINLISHENADVARESLHVISELMEYIIKSDISIDDYDNFLYHISLNISLSYKSAEYAVKIYSLIAKYAPNKQILNDVIPMIMDLFKKCTSNKIIKTRMENDKKTKNDEKMFQSDIDRLYDSSYDSIKKYIIQTIYYIMKSDFSFYYQFQSFFDFLFYNINGLSTTKSDPYFVKYIFKTLLLIIYNDEKEALHITNCIGNIYKKEDITDIGLNFEIYYYFIQNSEFIIVNPLSEIIIFNLFHFPDVFYDFCCNKIVLERFFVDMTTVLPYHVNSIFLSFFKTMVEHHNSDVVIEYLIDNDFIKEASFFLDSDNFEQIANYLIITDRIIEHKILLDNDEDILSEIYDDSIITENIDRILDEFPQYLKDHESYQNEDLSQNQIEQIQCSIELCQKIKDACIQECDE